MRFRWGQALILFLVLWLVVLLYLVFPLWRSSENEEKLSRAHNEIVRLSSENDKLRDLLKSVQEQVRMKYVLQMSEIQTPEIRTGL